MSLCDALLVFALLASLAALHFWWVAGWWKKRYHALRNQPVIREIERRLLTEEDIIQRAKERENARLRNHRS